MKVWLRFVDWLERRNVTFFLLALAAVALLTWIGI